AGLMGDGGMAEEAVVPAYMAHSLPDQVSIEQAAVLEPAAVALHAIRQGGLSAGMRCAVAGAGPIGLLIVQLARIAGARQIAVSDVSDERHSPQSGRSEEHTSELQSRSDLVCRLLLEKKNNVRLMPLNY